MRFDPDRHLLRPILFVSCGGFAGELLWRHRAHTVAILDTIPPCFRYLAIDYASDPPRPPDSQNSRFAPAVQADASFRPSEVSLIALPEDLAAIVERVQRGEDEIPVALRDISLELLARYTGGEGAQVPAFTRAALALAADDPGMDPQNTWQSILDRNLRELTPGGKALHDLMVGHSLPVGAIDDSAITAVVVVGACGGTGSGGLIPIAVTLRSLASRVGCKLKIQAFIVTGSYRKRDGREETKAALSHALDRDLEFAMTPSSGLIEFITGNLKASVRAPLFDEVIRFEASSRLAHDTTGVQEMAADLLLFRSLSKESLNRKRSRNNAAMAPKVLGLSDHPTWATKSSAKGQHDTISALIRKEGLR